MNLSDDGAPAVRAVRPSPEATSCDCKSLRTKTAALMNDNMRLHAELRMAHETIALHRREAANQLAERCFRERAKGLDENAKLLNLHVASLRLHEGRARQEVLLAIQEIVINLIGSEELAVFEVSPDGASLVLVSSFGIDANEYASIPMGHGVIGSVAQTGEAFLRPAGGGRAGRSVSPPSSGVRAASDLQTSSIGTAREHDLTACVPLRLCGRVVGLLAMFRLLDQKPNLVDLDRELLELVSTQAAPALYCAQLMAQ